MSVSKQAQIEQQAAAQQMTDTHHNTVQQSPTQSPDLKPRLVMCECVCFSTNGKGESKERY